MQDTIANLSFGFHGRGRLDCKNVIFKLQGCYFKILEVMCFNFPSSLYAASAAAQPNYLLMRKKLISPSSCKDFVIE